MLHDFEGNDDRVVIGGYLRVFVSYQSNMTTSNGTKFGKSKALDKVISTPGRIGACPWRKP